MSGNKTLAQLQAEKMAEKRFTEMMASAGVSHGRMALELLFFVPDSFRDAYAQLFYKAFAGKDDGGTGARGAATAEAAAVGKASGKGLQGLGGAKRKSFKRYWVVADDHALELKERIDKRLRAMARDIMEELEMGERSNQVRERGNRCDECGRLLQAGWKYCPNDGAGVTR